MNILIINHYAGSPELGMEFRPYYLGKEWIKQGHEVTIIAASFSHLRKKNIQTENKIKRQKIDGINYIWIKAPEYTGNGFGRIKNMFKFIKTIKKYAKKFSKEIKPNVVIASSTYPLDIYPARRIADLSNAKLVYEIHDLWPLSPMELGGYSKNHPFIAVMQRAENFAYKHVNAVISILPKTKEHTVAHGLSPEKWFHVPNGIVLEDWEKQEKIPEAYKNLLNKLRKDGKKIIGYVGGHAISNSLSTIIDAAKILKNDNNFAFIFVGSGTEKENLQKQAKNLQNIHFLEPIKKTQIPSFLNLTDYLIIAWQKKSLYRFGISPNKIFDYMMSEKPIIHAVEAGNDIVKEANCGISVEPENPDKIVEAIKTLQNIPQTELEKLGKNGKEFVLKNHDYKILSDNFLSFIEKC